MEIRRQASVVRRLRWVLLEHRNIENFDNNVKKSWWLPRIDEQPCKEHEVEEHQNWVQK
jgi:hypothetical protein